MPDITVTETGPSVSVGDATTPVVTVSAMGVPGPAGPSGSGAPGTTWHQGSGVPSSGLGIDGDFYLRSNGDVYGPKTSGVWGSPSASLLGPSGPTGATGPTGSAGTAGATGATGATGPAGATGATGPAGSAGAAGAAGADGKTLRNGTGVPGSGLGADGDFYIDDAVHAIYGPKASGAWGSSTSLIGPPGAAGATGPTGSAGATGSAGTAGATGPAGAAGANGTNPAFRGTWGNATTYAANDIVVLNERAFQAAQAGTGHDPLPSTQFVAATPAIIDGGDGGPYEMGVKVVPTGDVRLTGVAFYKAAANVGTHVGRVWQLGANGEYYLVNQATFTGETASGWQAVPLTVDLAAGTTYIVSCAFPSGHYSVDAHYYDSPVTVGSLTAPAGGGMYSTTVGHVPDHAFNNASYSVAPVWGEPDPAWWQEIGSWQLLAGFPSAQESAAAYVLAQIGANGGIAGLDGFGHLAGGASGIATVAAGSTSAAVAHGLPRTPTVQEASVTATNSLGAATRFWVSAIDATNITISVDVAPGGSGAAFVWQVHNL